MRLTLLAVVALLVCHEVAPKKNDDTGVGNCGTCPDGSEPVTTFVDSDGDGFGGDKTGNVACVENIAAGNTDKSGDCDDDNGGIFPGAVELCGTTDEDCDPSTEATDRTYYADSDGDSYGDPAVSVADCEAPEGYVLNDEDCNDADAAYNPDAVEEDCNDPNDYNCDGSVDFTDNDGDGTAACADCDDEDPSRSPTFGEVCDGVDNDCDTIIDPSTSLDAQTWYLDLDGDGYGDGDGTGIRTCDGPVGYAPNGDDCDDSNASINPDAAEVCDADDVDEDCDGTVDDADDDVSDQPTWYRDADADGYGDANQSIIACDAPAGYTDVVGDCDDADPQENGANAEICDGLDNDCDGQVDEGAAGGSSAWYQDNDGDGYGNTGAAQYACTQPVGFVTTGTDCDDNNASAYPGSVEVCGGGDEDCDGQVDESGAVNATSWYADVDGDGYGDPSTSTIACTQPFAYVSNSDDCNDRTATAYPGGTETCDSQNIDEDCNGLADDDDSNPANTSRFYYDVDYDGYGAGVGIDLCDRVGSIVTNNTDCDDADSTIYPNAIETCDLVDEDCDGQVDEGTSGTLWFEDSDGDSYGNLGSQQLSCFAPAGSVANSNDCNDIDPYTYPGADEYCNSSDDDCDGYADDNPVDGTTWYIDQDSDTYGNPNTTYLSCNQPFGYVADDTDCNDNRAAINPGASEVCDSQDIDEDCDGLTEDNDPNVSGSSQTTVYIDADGDGFGVTATVALTCDVGSGTSTIDGDCDDTNALVSPAEAEICDASNVDEDCDGLADDADPGVTRSTWSTWYLDADGDSFGLSSSLYSACDQPAGYVADRTDCLDSNSSVNPGQSEVCYDGLDNNCDGVTSCGLYSQLSLADADIRIDGYTAGDAAGQSVLGLGDINSDGYDDVAIGNEGFDYNGRSAAGGVHIYYGPLTNTDTRTAAVVLGGGTAQDRAGWALDRGDFDGDGTQELLIGAPQEDAGGASAGAVYIRSTTFASASISLSTGGFTAKLVGENGSDFAGYVLSNAGDTNGDGNDDVLIGSYGYDQPQNLAGAAYLVPGPISGTLDLGTTSSLTRFTGTTTAANAGKAVAGVGDTDGDGMDDILVGAPGSNVSGNASGVAYLLFGSFGNGNQSLSTADIELRASTSYQSMGSAVSRAGDQNADGYADYWVSAGAADSGASNTGSVYLIAGNSVSGVQTTANIALATITGELANDDLATTVFSADIDGDGHEDALLGAVDVDTNGTQSGAVYMCPGPIAGTYTVVDCSAKILGSNAADKVGTSISAGDTDGDGFEDLLLGVPGVDTLGSGGGALYMYRGG